MNKGNQPTDDGNFFFKEEELAAALAAEPFLQDYIRPFYGADEFIKNKKRYCLWLVNASPAELRRSKIIMERLRNIKEFREKSPKAATRQCAETPALFQEIRQPDCNYLLVPRVSSERRAYVPIGYMDKQAIASDAVLIIPSASLYHFGVLTSWVHMAWMRAVCGRLETRYRYSKDVVYNNFPWPEADEAAVAAISETAQAILDARAAYPDSSLADLYDDTLMPPDLRRAHRNNDRAVLRAYGFPTNDSFTESDCVARLFQLYADWGK